MSFADHGIGARAYRRAVAVWALAIALSSCAQGDSSNTGTLITPESANGIAGSYAAKRFEALGANDVGALKSAETSTALTMDLQIAAAYVITKPSTPIPVVSKVDSYTPHQQSYPATFVSIVSFVDGGAEVMGFSRETSSDQWRLAEVAGMEKAAPIALSKGSDGYALPTVSSSRYPYDPSELVPFYFDTECQSTPPCGIPGGAKLGPYSSQLPSNLSSAVAGEVLTTEIPNVAEMTKRDSEAGVYLGYWALVQTPPKFPWYQLKSGGSLRFITVAEQFQFGFRQGCFRVQKAGDVGNALLGPGLYRSVTEHVQDEFLVEVPTSTAAGPMTGIAETSAILGNDTDSNGCR